MPTTTTTIKVTWDDGTSTTFTTTGTVTASADGKSKSFTGRASGETEDSDFTIYLAHVRVWSQKATTA